MTIKLLKKLIKEESLKIKKERYEEMLLEKAESEKQRKWACAQMGDDFKGEKSLSKEEAEKMCKDPLKKEISAMAGGAVAGCSGAGKKKKKKDEEETLIREDDIVERILNAFLNKENDDNADG